MEGSTLSGPLNVFNCTGGPIPMDVYLTIRRPAEKILKLEKIEVSARIPSIL